MPVLRTLIYSALGGSILHVSMRLARHSHRNGAHRDQRFLPVASAYPAAYPAAKIEAAVAPPLLALVIAPSRALQVIPKTDEPDIVARIGQSAAARIQRLGAKLIEDFQNFEDRGIEGWSTLLQCELDLHLAALEEAFARQIRSLHDLRDLTLQRDVRMNGLAIEIELLCERVVTYAIPAPKVTEMEDAEKRRERADAERRKMKAIFAFEETAKQESKPVQQEQETKRVRCPNCTSPHTRPAYRSNFVDRCLRPICANPWRCRGCGSRFYRFVWGASVSLDLVRRPWRAVTGRLSRSTRVRKSKQSHDLAH